MLKNPHTIWEEYEGMKFLVLWLSSVSMFFPAEVAGLA